MRNLKILPSFINLRQPCSKYIRQNYSFIKNPPLPVYNAEMALLPQHKMQKDTGQHCKQGKMLENSFTWILGEKNCARSPLI